MIRVPINRFDITDMETDKDIRLRQWLLVLRLSLNRDDPLISRIEGQEGLVLDYVEQGVKWQYDPGRAHPDYDHKSLDTCRIGIAGALHHGGIWRPTGLGPGHRFAFGVAPGLRSYTQVQIRFSYDAIEDGYNDYAKPTECLGPAERATVIKPGERLRRLTEAPEPLDTVTRNRRVRTFG